MVQVFKVIFAVGSAVAAYAIFSAALKTDRRERDAAHAQARAAPAGADAAQKPVAWDRLARASSMWIVDKRVGVDNSARVFQEL